MRKMLFDYTNTQIDESITLDALAKTFHFFEMLEENASTTPVTLPRQAGLANDIIDAFAFVKKYNDNPKTCQLSFDRAFLQLVNTCEFLGPKYTKGTWKTVPFDVLSDWALSADITMFHTVVTNLIPHAFLKIDRQSRNVDLQFPVLSTKVASNPLWNGIAHLPTLPACLQCETPFRKVYEEFFYSIDDYHDLIINKNKESMLSKCMYDLLTLQQKEQLHSSFRMKSLLKTADFFNQEIEIVVYRQRKRLLDQMIDVIRNRSRIVETITNLEKEVKRHKQFMESPSYSAYFIQFFEKKYKRPSNPNNILDPALLNRIAREYAADNGAVLQKCLTGLETRVKNKRDALVDADARVASKKREIQELSAWLVELMHIARHERDKTRYFKLMSNMLQRRYILETICAEFCISDACKKELIKWFDAFYHKQTKAFQWDSYKVFCDVPECREKAKHVYLMNETPRYTRRFSDDLIVIDNWDSETLDSWIQWTQTVLYISNTRCNGLCGLKRVARCSAHRDQNTTSRKRQKH